MAFTFGWLLKHMGSKLQIITLKDIGYMVFFTTTLIVVCSWIFARFQPAPHYVEYDLTTSIADEYNCPSLALPPIVLKVCLHPDDIDAEVSSAVHYEGCWRRPEMTSFYRVVRREPDYGVVDVGAGIGIYSLVAASQGRQVLAVEPVPDNIFRLHKSLKMLDTSLQGLVRVLMNAVSNTTRPAHLTWPQGHISLAHVLREDQTCSGEYCAGTYLLALDDLLPYIHFKKAFLKISASGDEAGVLSRASRFFKKLDIPLVFMDFEAGRRLCEGMASGRIAPSDPGVVALAASMRFLFARQYVPHHGVTGELLPGTKCQTWPPTTVIWEHVRFKGSYT